MDKLLNFTPSATKTIVPSLTLPGGDMAFDTARTSKIHIRTQQMGKKWITTIEGLDTDLDQTRIASAIKRSLHCAASVEKSPDETEFIKLSGNQREFLRDWLISNEVLTEKEAKDRLMLHGA
jgi:translation initiation factor 1